MSTPSIPNITLRQTMLSFAYLAYTGEGLTDSNPESSILDSINAALPNIQIPSADNETLADWSIVWGPVTYTVPGSLYQDNMLYVVNKSGTSDYVIATRGTNFGSQVDWFLEDFEVVNTMPWPMPGAQSNCESGSVISESTSIGMTIQVDDSLMVDSTGTGLLQFLLNTTDANGAINVCVTGHSLGGVLSNTLALYLTENPSLWDSSGDSIVSCVSFAAPTAGNDLFAENAESVFAASATNQGSFPGWDSALGTNLDNVMCDMDIVPLFCTSSNVYTGSAAGKMFSVYASPTNAGNNIDFSKLPNVLAEEEWTFFQSLVLSNLAGMMDHDYTQLLANTAFQGAFMGSTLYLNDPLYGLTPFLEAFAAQAGWQHSNSYPIYLGMNILSDPSIVVRNTGTQDVPTITSISPDTADRVHIAGVDVTINGTGFSTSMYENFIVFSDDTNPIPYRITAATATQISAVFYVEDAQDCTQSVSVAVTAPYYTSNAVDFTID